MSQKVLGPRPGSGVHHFCLYFVSQNTITWPYQLQTRLWNVIWLHAPTEEATDQFPSFYSIIFDCVDSLFHYSHV